MRGRKISCIRFFNDKVILVNDIEVLQVLSQKLEEGVKEYGMKMNAGRTKIVRLNGTENIKVIAKERKCNRPCKIQLCWRTLTAYWKNEVELKARTDMAKEAFNNNKKRTVFQHWHSGDDNESSEVFASLECFAVGA